MNTLTPPIGKRDHIRGNPRAPVSLVEYGDFECPYCGEAYPIIEQILEERGDELLFAFRHFPLSQIHPHALHAAAAAEAAGFQGKFWEMHGMLFTHQDALEDEDLVSYAEALDLDTKLFVDDMASNKVQQKIREDFLSGVRSGVNGTPTFFINGRRHEGSYDYDTLLAAIDSVQEGRHAMV